ncbi:MAG: SMP-30/gluconolactonase/LRE family protein [Rhodospirillales bacterium]|jgi:xylono-1,5-lactonase|nr:SMP-30/gluconolactonase/LRE family protein [Rhodospirillales bacterium]
MAEAKCVWDLGATLGEGPIWDAAEQAVYFVDIKQDCVHRYTPSTGEAKTWQFERQICSVTRRSRGGFVATTRHSFAFLDLAAGKVEEIAPVDIDNPDMRFNDAKADGRGRLWAGTMDDTESGEKSGVLYRLDPDRSWREMDDGYGVTNGPAFAIDGKTMYHTDSPARTIYAFDVDDAGSISNKRVFIKFSEEDGYPDGMTVDAQGYLWVAHYRGWRVSRFSPDGRLDRAFALPVAQVTSCVFGGADLETLYVTTATQTLDEDELLGQPLAGGLFEIPTGIRGLQSAEFAG